MCPSLSNKPLWAQAQRCEKGELEARECRCERSLWAAALQRAALSASQTFVAGVRAVLLQQPCVVCWGRCGSRCILCSPQGSTGRTGCTRPARRSSAARAASVCSTGTPTCPSAGVSSTASPPTCLSVALMAGSMKTTVSSIEPRVCRGRKSTLSTARTVSSKVGRCWK